VEGTLWKTVDSFCSSDIKPGVFLENLCFTVDQPKPFGWTDDGSKDTIVGLGVPGTGIPEFSLTHNPPSQVPLDLEKATDVVSVMSRTWATRRLASLVHLVVSYTRQEDSNVFFSPLYHFDVNITMLASTSLEYFPK
jgi:hypothetical protein